MGRILVQLESTRATLVMFSGGIDSTAMLVKLLAAERRPLRVHHIHMVNQEQARDGGTARGRRGPRLLPQA
jgi:tRNA(Ile)-lysidine synthase TilS/MesJ